VLNGLAVGCIYGLVALGFVLIYKTTELVNFAQGDLMMLGATVLRRVIGQPQFAVVMLTIGLAATFRTFASITWGSEIYTLPTPFSARSTMAGKVNVSHEYVSIIVGTVLLCAALYAFFRYTRVGMAMQATSQNQLAAYYMGIPVKRMFSLIWTISAGVAALAGVLLAPVSLIDVNLVGRSIRAPSGRSSRWSRAGAGFASSIRSRSDADSHQPGFPDRALRAQPGDPCLRRIAWAW
jgi:branched-chain amino acid transport system permease protein